MIKNIKRIARKILYVNQVQVYWSKSENWGDALSPVLVEYFSGKKARFAAGSERFKYMVVGSVLQKADARTEVWGAGFIASDSEVIQNPQKIHAVRGPLTRERLLDLGIESPEVYGDPALLFPLFYTPEVRKSYRLGIVPHYTDKGNLWLNAFAQREDVKIIDIEGGIYRVVDEINACETVVSSSLHGIICADAYGIPAGWIKLGNELEGDDFKFFDYHASIGVSRPEALQVNEETDVEDLISHTTAAEMDIDLRQLLEVCPFLDKEVRGKVLDDQFRQVKTVM